MREVNESVTFPATGIKISTIGEGSSHQRTFVMYQLNFEPKEFTVQNPFDI